MDFLVAIDELDDAVHDARPVPLTDQVRLPLDRLQAHVDTVRRHLDPDLPRRLEAELLLDRLDALVREAKPVPLTEQVRVDKGALYEILDALRALLARS